MAVQGVSGLASGIDTAGIIDALITADGAAAKVLSARKDIITTRLDAVRTYNAKLLSAQLDLSDLRRTATYTVRKATSSSEASVSATASGNASLGVTQVDVVAIAKAQQRSSAGYASSTTDIGTGNIVLQLGNGAQKTLSIASGSGSLEGIAQAINGAGTGVSASVINDGSGGASAYRLVLQSSVTGTANRISISADGGLSDLFASRSTAQPDAVTPLGAGGLNITVASGAVHAFSIGAGASSLTDIRDAINADLGLGATASLVNDSGQQRLVLTPTAGGASIGVTGSGSLAGLFAPGANVLTEAADAVVKLGSGAGAITITKSSNTISDLISGVTLTVKAPGTAISIGVSNDTTKAKDAIAKFVTSYNGAVTYLNSVMSYDASTKKAGLLFSETGLRRGLNDLSRAFSSADASLPTSMNAISALGITIDKQAGTYAIDDAKLDAQLAADPAGVAKLFTNSGTTSNGLVQFGALSEDTAVDKAFTVDITAAPEQALIGNTGDLAATTVIGTANKDLSLQVNGKLYNITLAEGSYTRAALATHLAASINAVADSASKVSASLNGNGLELRSALYGATQTIQVIGGSALADLQLAITSDSGVDVAGSITVGGVTTAATGSGQVLAGADGSKAKGLRLTVSATAPLSGVVVNARKGVAQLTTERLRGLTDASKGSVVGKEDQLQATIADISKQMTKSDERLAVRRKRYESQFLQMEKLISQFKSQGNFLSSQITGFENAASAYAKG
jgi:flagellar hook-associated protein 2